MTAATSSVRSSSRERFVTKREVAEHLAFSARWVELRVAEGMPSYRFGGRRRFRISEVERWLRQHGKKAA